LEAGQVLEKYMVSAEGRTKELIRWISWAPAITKDGGITEEG
jgi:hypothetical protein